jgi:FAD/FMN-containing dehydrogenase
MKRRTFFRSALAAGATLALRPATGFSALTHSSRRFRSDVDAVTGDGRPVTLTGKAIEELRSRLFGRLLLADDDGYDDARRILNPSFDRRPAIIAQVTGVADIQAAVNFAAEHDGLLLAVKCGGHSFSGTSTCDRGMMIDLSPFRDVRIDPVARRAWVTGGSLLGHVDHETMAHGLVTPLGTVSHTGVGGLVTGGGFGRLSRKFGLAIDNLTSVHVVTADGQFHRASADENPDLFWGVRGGGGNFGIVTSFEFRLHPMQRQVMAGRIVYPIERAKEALTLFAEYGPQASDDLNLGFVMAQPPGGEPGAFVFDVCYAGPADRVDAELAPLRSLGRPLADDVTAQDYVAVQRSGDNSDPRAMGIYLKGGFVPDFPADFVSAIVERFEGHPARTTAIFSQEGGGAVARVAPDATAFSQRDLRANVLSVVGWRFGDDPSQHIEWLRQYWAGLERYSYGFYVNDLEPDHTAAAIQANYRQNHDRLVAVKNRYDPTNLFRLNANVKPTV